MRDFKQPGIRHFSAVMVALILLFAPGIVLAQILPGEGGSDCGIDCVFCTGSPNNWIGDGVCQSCHEGTSGYWTQYCRVGSCLTCTTLARGEAAAVHALTEQLTRSDLHGLSSIVAEHGSQMLVYPARHLVVVIGGCNGRALQAVAFLPSSKIQELERLGVQSLVSFLKEGTSASGGTRAVGE